MFPHELASNGLGARAIAGGAIQRGEVSYSHLPKASPADEKKNQAIQATLEKRISMNFLNKTPLSDLIRYIEQSTQDEAAGFPMGIPIYVDPQNLQDAEQTMASTVSINLEGVGLRTTLHLALKQLNLTYIVENGLLIIVSTNSDSDYSSLLPTKPKPANPSGGGFR